MTSSRIETSGHHDSLAPGARVLVRDEEWVVQRVERASTGGHVIHASGVSELVSGKAAIFLTGLEKKIEVIDPARTRLVPDESPRYQNSILYMESLIRRTPPTDEKLYVGHRAAMDPVPYQLDPAIQALRQPRQRILIADAVGLGKTLEAGILLAELIRRGRGRRILVLAVKSMLTQFQKELWSRFAIPLVRLDSAGIQRIRSRIPTNHNPFFYFDKAIISIDTLKQDAEYRTYLESAWWDIIVIDEAHNVAERGKKNSMRARLARLLSGRSDTLIMLSATPHDGSARSFASLMNMLDPTAIADPDTYGPEDIKGLFIRRFKKDIQDQVRHAFREREISVARAQASPAEEEAFDILTSLSFRRIDRKRAGHQLFRTTLEKALFSSPAACIATIENRIRRLEKHEDPDTAQDIEGLESLKNALMLISPGNFSKYQRLISLIKDKRKGLGWNGRDRQDRLVIFTERIDTLKFLHSQLPEDLGLKARQVEILHGGLSDIDQQRIVEDFGREESPVRLLIASDVASEGINLHYLCHKMIHFDIPWSLMVFQQRNGRIDRYGQERTPVISYLLSESQNRKIRGDLRILELLIRKDEQARKNIGDPSALMGVYDIDLEEEVTARAMDEQKSPEEFEKELEQNLEKTFDPLALLMDQDDSANEKEPDYQEPVQSMPSFFQDDFEYLRSAVSYLQKHDPFHAEIYTDEKRIDFFAPLDLEHRFRLLPSEIWPQDRRFILSADREIIKKEIKRSRRDEKAWPRIHYLYELNPVVEWATDRLLAVFKRNEAPVLKLPKLLVDGQDIFIISGLIPNLKGQPLVHRWLGVEFRSGSVEKEPRDFFEIMKELGLGTAALPNLSHEADLERLQGLLPEAVEWARAWMSDFYREFAEKTGPRLDEQLERLVRLKEKQYRQLEFSAQAGNRPETIVKSRKEQRRREIDRIFHEYTAWIKETMTAEDRPYLKVVGVLTA